MPNINDIPASEISLTPPGESVNPQEGNILKVDKSLIQTPEQFQEAKFGTPGQQALTAVEGLTHGFAGPVATGVEKGLSAIGIPGLTPEEQEARAAANPVIHYGSEATGFGIGALTGTGEARAAAKIGEGAVALSGLGKGAGILSKVAATGVRGGAELAALQTGDEISKVINEDPNQTLGSAAINIGLSAVLGGGGGMALGSVSPLFRTAANKIGISKLASDFMGETQFLRGAPDMVSGAAKELADRMVETEALKAAAMPIEEIAPKESILTEGPFKNFPAAPETPLLKEPSPVLENGPPKIGNLDKLLENVNASEKELFPKLGEGLDPQKLQEVLAKGKSSAVKSYLDSTQKLADALAKAHVSSDLEIPVEAQFNPTPILNRSLGTAATTGQKLAQWAHQKGAEKLAEMAGKSAAQAVGGIAGAIVGHPVIGALASEKVLGPAFSALAKPFAEKAIDSEAMRATIDYASNVIKGQEILSKSVKDFFSTGEVVPKFLIPTITSREKLITSLASKENPQNATKTGGKIGHYLPDHGMAAAALAGTAVSYLNGLKPNPQPLNPFDATPSPDKNTMNNYHRQLDIAQQPLMVLKFAKDGTLMPQDVKTIQTIYPGLHAAMVSKINNALIHEKANGKPIPYAQRMSLSALTGSVLDSTFASVNMQSIIRSAGTQQQAVQTNQKNRKSSATGAQLRAIGKAQDLYLTRSDRREAGGKM